MLSDCIIVKSLIITASKFDHFERQLTLTDNIHNDRIVHYLFSGDRSEFQNYTVLQSLNIIFVFANIADPDEMPHFKALHLNRHCLPKYPFRGSSIQRVYSISF